MWLLGRTRRLFALVLAAGALLVYCLSAMALIGGGFGGGGYRLGAPVAAPAVAVEAAAGGWRPLFNRSEVRAQPVRELLPYITDRCSGRVPCMAPGTPLFHRWRLWLPELDAWRDGGQAACGSACDVVSDPARADAVLFHGRDLEPRQPALGRHPSQRWIYINMESPLATKRHGYDMSSDPKFRYLFNWTATTSLTSSVHLPYGSWERRSQPLEGPVYSGSSKKKYMAFAAFSNCKYSFNNRTAKVAELQHYMEVHVYGDCGDRQLSRKWSEWQRVSEQYRFYLSFENALCRDYITEKFHKNGLGSHAVPVVFGGLSRADYERVSPPDSFVYALDFISMRQLAEHLVHLAADETRYAAFFNWKRHYRASPKASLLCGICAKLHTDRQTSVADLSLFYDIGRNCRPPDFQYLP